MLKDLVIPACVLLFYLVLRWDINDDFKKWLENKGVKHKREFFLRIALLLPCIVGFTYASPVNWYYGFIISGLMVGSSFMLLFDGLYNNKRKFNFWFNGSNGPHDRSRFDRFWSNMPNWKEATIKIGASLVFVAIYYLTFLTWF